MLFRRFYDDALAQASYLLGCERTGEAIVIDPNLDMEQYVRAAAEHGVCINHVAETHIHADFGSGTRALARATGARACVSGEGGALFGSLQAFARLPDHLQIWPGHGAGSACGKAMSAAPQSTLGYERVANWALAPTDVETFIDRALDGQREPPAYFGVMKHRNRAGMLPAPSPWSRRPSVTETARAGDEGACIVDVRNRDEWARGHVPGATLVPLPELPTRLDEIPRDRPLFVHCQRGARSAAAATLDAFGFMDVHDVRGGFTAWEAAALPVER